jgi:hypothetical protein
MDNTLHGSDALASPYPLLPFHLLVRLKPHFRGEFVVSAYIAYKKRTGQAYTTPRKPNNFTENLIPKRVKLDDKYRGGTKMSRKRTVYSAEFKTRLVLEVLREEKTLNEIASTNNVNLANALKISSLSSNSASSSASRMVKS